MARTSDTPPPAAEEALPHPTEVADAGRLDPPSETPPAAGRLAPVQLTAEQRASLPDLAITPDYVEVFRDNFRQSRLDISKWWTRFIFANGTLDYLNDEWQRFRELPENHTMTPQGLRLTALPHNGQYWPSGMVRSKQCFNITDGNDYIFECRARVPRGVGTWSGFWIAADQRPADLGDWNKYPLWPPEIDFMEIVNNGQDDTTRMLHLNVHVREWPGNPQQALDMEARPDFSWQWKVWWAPFDFADDFHVFSYHYKFPIGTWYCDGLFIARMRYAWVNDDRLPSGPAHICAQLSVGGAWAGRYGVDTSAFPQSLDIDYIRVLQRFQRGVIGHDFLEGGNGGNGGNGGVNPGPEGPTDAQVRTAMQSALNYLNSITPFPPGSTLDPNLMTAVDTAADALRHGLAGSAE